MLAELQSHLRRGRLTHAAQAVVFAGLGRKEEALQALERGWAQRDDSMLAVAFDPRLQALHSDSRFQAMQSKWLKSAEYAASAGRSADTNL
jgi:hypothetical protein